MMYEHFSGVTKSVRGMWLDALIKIESIVSMDRSLVLLAHIPWLRSVCAVDYEYAYSSHGHRRAKTACCLSIGHGSLDSATIWRAVCCIPSATGQVIIA